MASRGERTERDGRTKAELDAKPQTERGLGEKREEGS